MSIQRLRTIGSCCTDDDHVDEEGLVGRKSKMETFEAWSGTPLQAKFMD